MGEYRKALLLAPNVERKVILLSILGAELARQGKKTEADQCFAEGYQLAEAAGEPRALMRLIEQHSWAAAVNKEFAVVHSLAARGIELSKQLGDHTRQGIFLINLGSAELELGARRALQLHQEAHQIGESNNDEPLEANALYAIGIDYHAMEDQVAAQGHLQRAHKLFVETGHTEMATEVKEFMKRFGYVI